MNGIAQAAEDSGIPRFSPAEVAILPRLLRGDTEKGIALQLGKGARTVNKQVASIYRAYGVNSRVELIHRHYGLLARENLAENRPDGVTTPLKGLLAAPHNRPATRKRRGK